MFDLSNNLDNFPQGHPVRVYLEENILVRELFEELFKTDINEDFEKFFNIFNQLCLVEKHFARKENQLFPYLEKYGWTTPSQNMWAFHDQIREEIKVIRKLVESKNLENVLNNAITLYNSLTHLFQVEEGKLLPRALELLSEDDWKEMREGDEEIGWMFSTPPIRYPELEKKSIFIQAKIRKKELYLFQLR